MKGCVWPQPTHFSETNKEDNLSWEQQRGKAEINRTSFAGSGPLKDRSWAKLTNEQTNLKLE